MTWRDRLIGLAVFAAAFGVLACMALLLGALCPPKPTITELPPTFKIMTIKVDGQTVVLPFFTEHTNVEITIKP